MDASCRLEKIASFQSCPIFYGAGWWYPIHKYSELSELWEILKSIEMMAGIAKLIEWGWALHPSVVKQSIYLGTTNANRMTRLKKCKAVISSAKYTALPA